MRWAILGISVFILGLVAFLGFGYFFVRLMVEGVPGNERINADPANRPEMVRVTLEWGRLAPFPETAREFQIHTEGGSFTRIFRGSFVDTAENIRSWLTSSPGVRDGKEEKEGVHILKTGKGDTHGEVIVAPDGSNVTFCVYCS